MTYLSFIAVAYIIIAIIVFLVVLRNEYTFYGYLEVFDLFYAGLIGILFLPIAIFYILDSLIDKFIHFKILKKWHGTQFYL